jgi:glycosyltransferase involved in cell wall biosynthesis
MRILFICKSYWPVVGGVERHVRTLAELLAAEHEVTVLAMRTAPRRDSPLDGNLWPCPRFSSFEHDGVTVRQLRTRRAPLRYLPFALRMVPGVRRAFYGRGRFALARLVVPALAQAVRCAVQQADVVHVFGDEFLALASVESARAARRPVLINGFVHEHAWGDDPVSVRAYQRADLVVAMRPEDAEYYVRLGVPTDRVRVGGVGVAGPVSDAPAFAHDPDRPVVLFLGRRVPYKGVDLLVGAADTLAARHPGVRIVLAGPGPSPRSTASAVEDVGLVSETERHDWLARADVLCLLSAHETYGLCVLEAWSYGIPVVVSDIPVLSALMRESRGGVEVPRTPAAVANVLGDLLDDPARRARLGAAGHAFWLANAIPDVYAARHLTLYRNLTGTSESHADAAALPQRRGDSAATLYYNR